MDEMNEAALVTANWWADHVFGGTVASNGDGLSMMLGLVAGSQGVPADTSKRDEFVARLGANIISEMKRSIQYDEERGGRSFPAVVTLSTDYGPEGTLLRLSRELELRGSFPWKTVTWTYVDHFVTSLGYGTSDSLEWAADSYVRPACGIGQYHDTKYRRLPWKCSAPKYHPVNAHVFDTPDPLCQAPDPVNPDRLCLRPKNDEAHDTEDGWMVRLLHEFQGEAK